ncbi:MAG: DNA alkylation repair protein [Methanomassiliicoccaceae archaeon]|nr:DNA alkylation repair protein [Methanomassiliicoccaceae archaeon]
MTRLIGELRSESDTKYKNFNSGLIKSKKDLIGVRMPKLRKMASKIIEDDWRSFISEEMIVLEEDMIAALVIANAKMPPGERLELTKRFVPSIDNWAVCDIFCGDWKASAEIKDELWEYCGELLASGEEFKMRVGAVMMLSKFLDEEHIDGVLARFTLYKNDGYYYKMGAAWTLSYCYLKYQDRTEALLRTGKLGRDVQNLAISKVRESRRADDAMRERVKSFRL